MKSHVKSIGLVWITVQDIKKSIAFYTEVVGLKLVEYHEEFRWAELAGETGARLGIGEYNPAYASDGVHPGQNGVVTFSVANIQEAIQIAKEKGATFVGSLQEVPGHVQMQTVMDRDGNKFQFVQILHS